MFTLIFSSPSVDKEEEIIVHEATAPVMNKKQLDESLKEVQETLNKIFDIEASQPLEAINPKQKKMLEIKQRRRQKYFETLDKDSARRKNRTKINFEDYTVGSHNRLIKKPEDWKERHLVISLFFEPKKVHNSISQNAYFVN